MGNIVKRGSVYYIRYEGPSHTDGRRNQKKESCPGMNKRQAEDLLRRRETEVRNGSYIDTDNLTLSAWFKSWIERKSNSLSPTTTEDYHKKFRTIIEPVLGNMAVQKLKPIAIQQLLDKLLLRLSPKTTRNVAGIIHSCLQDAVVLGVVQTNPADNLMLPAKPDPNIQLPETGDLNKMLTALKATPYRLPFLLIVGTAMRRGEVIGLQWIDFREDTRTLIIARATVQTRGSVGEKLPKSGRKRAILLPTNLVEELKQHREILKSKGIDSKWIVTTETGEHMTPGSLSKGIQLAMHRSGVKASMHKWRHDQATKLIVAGVPTKIVSERLGHATTNITENIYTHIIPIMQTPAVDILDRDWADQNGDDSVKNAE